MLDTIFSGDIQSIIVRLEYLLSSYSYNKYNKEQYLHLYNTKYFDVPTACNYIFNDSIPKSKAILVYQFTKTYRNNLCSLGCNIESYSLAVNTTRKIWLSKAALSLLMLIYNKEYREYHNINKVQIRSKIRLLVRG